jgi:hypothetical protein
MCICGPCGSGTRDCAGYSMPCRWPRRSTPISDPFTTTVDLARMLAGARMSASLARPLVRSSRWPELACLPRSHNRWYGAPMAAADSSGCRPELVWPPAGVRVPAKRAVLARMAAGRESMRSPRLCPRQSHGRGLLISCISLG